MKNAKTLTRMQKFSRFLLCLLLLSVVLTVLPLAASADESPVGDWFYSAEDGNVTLTHRGVTYYYLGATDSAPALGWLHWAPEKDLRYDVKEVIVEDRDVRVQATIRTDAVGSGLLYVETDSPEDIYPGIYMTQEAFDEYYYDFGAQGVAVSKSKNQKEYRAWLPDGIESVYDLMMYGEYTVVTQNMVTASGVRYLLSETNESRSLFRGDAILFYAQGSYMIATAENYFAQSKTYRPTGEPGVAARRLTSSDAEMILTAIENLAPVVCETAVIEETPYDSESERIGTAISLSIVAFFIAAPAVVFLIFGLVFPRLAKYRYAKRWYVLAGFAAAWIVLLAALVVVIIALM